MATEQPNKALAYMAWMEATEAFRAAVQPPVAQEAPSQEAKQALAVDLELKLAALKAAHGLM